MYDFKNNLISSGSPCDKTDTPLTGLIYLTGSAYFLQWFEGVFEPLITYMVTPKGLIEKQSQNILHYHVSYIASNYYGF